MGQWCRLAHHVGPAVRGGAAPGQLYGAPVGLAQDQEGGLLIADDVGVVLDVTGVPFRGERRSDNGPAHTDAARAAIR